MTIISMERRKENREEKQVKAGKLTLADLDSLAEGGEGITKGVVSVIFGTGNPQDVALQFLSGEKLDKEVENKGAAGELAVLIRSAFEVELPENEELADWRTRLARHILTTDLIANIRGEIPSKLATIKTASKPATREACVALVKSWRLRRDLRCPGIAVSIVIDQGWKLRVGHRDIYPPFDHYHFLCISRGRKEGGTEDCHQEDRKP